MVITDRGRPAHVLVTFEEYKRLTGARTKIADLLALPEGDDVELDFPRSKNLARAANLA